MSKKERNDNALKTWYRQNVLDLPRGHSWSRAENDRIGLIQHLNPRTIEKMKPALWSFYGPFTNAMTQKMINRNMGGHLKLEIVSPQILERLVGERHTQALFTASLKGRMLQWQVTPRIAVDKLNYLRGGNIQYISHLERVGRDQPFPVYKVIHYNAFMQYGRFYLIDIGDRFVFDRDQLHAMEKARELFSRSLRENLSSGKV